MPIPIGISGSRAASILGLSPYQTPISVWQAIMEQREPGFNAAQGYEYQPFEGNAATRFGTAFEDAILQLTEEHYGADITDRQKFIEKTIGNGVPLTCHLDGIMGDAIIEAKTTSYFSLRDDWGEPGSDRVPVGYQLQAQHNMLLAGLDRCIIPVLAFPRRVEEWEEMGVEIAEVERSHYIKLRDYHRTPIQWARILDEMGYLQFYEIKNDIILQAEMLNRYEEWWNAYVIGRTPPPVRSYDDIRALVREPHGTIVADENIERLMSEYKNIGEEISTSGPLAKRREQIKTAVLDWMRGAGFTDDDESQDKWILRGQDGKKVASYGKNKNGVYAFR